MWWEAATWELQNLDKSDFTCHLLGFPIFRMEIMILFKGAIYTEIVIAILSDILVSWRVLGAMQEGQGNGTPL